MLECKLGPPFTIGIYLYDIGIYIAELKGWVSLGYSVNSVTAGLGCEGAVENLVPVFGTLPRVMEKTLQCRTKLSAIEI